MLAGVSMIRKSYLSFIFAMTFFNLEAGSVSSRKTVGSATKSSDDRITSKPPFR